MVVNGTNMCNKFHQNPRLQSSIGILFLHGMTEYKTITVKERCLPTALQTYQITTVTDASLLSYFPTYETMILLTPHLWYSLHFCLQIYAKCMSTWLPMTHDSTDLKMLNTVINRNNPMA